MTRFAFASLLAALSAFAAVQFDPPPLGAQEKGKGKAKTKETTPPPIGEKEDLSRVLPVFDPGSHTQPISAMGFTKDKAKLVTVGQDFTVQVWNAATGERLDILRLPGYGREKGYDPGRWDVAAVSPDGTRVAIGGQVKYLNGEGDDNSARLLLVDVVKRSLVRIQIRTGRGRPVTALGFSPDGNTLAVGVAEGPKEDAVLMVVGDLTRRANQGRPGLQTNDCQQIPLPANPTEFAFSPDGKRLAVGGKQNKKLTLWDVPAGAAPQPKLAKELTLDTNTMGLGWSPDGKQFVHAIKIIEADGTTRIRGFDVRTADGELVKAWRNDDLAPVLNKKGQFGTIFNVRFLDANSIYFVANGGFGGEGGTIAGVLDTVAKTTRDLGSHPEGMVTVPIGAVSADGRTVAYTVTGNTEVLIGTPDGKMSVRCGQRTPLPYYIGWSNDPAKPGFAWTADRDTRRIQERDPANLKFGFDLGQVAPIGAIRGTNYDTARWKHGEWSVKVVGGPKKGPNDGFRGMSRLMKGETPIAGIPVGQGGARTLIPNGDQPPLVALRAHPPYEPERCLVYKPDGSLFKELLPGATTFGDMVSSPDGRFLAVTTGTPRIVIYRTDATPYPLLSFAQLNGEWVCWTPEGYYAASPGGEKLFGWALNNGPNELVTFHPAEKYAKQFRRPDIIKLVIEKGSVKEALAAMSAKPADLNQIAPPGAKLTLVEQRGSTVTVKATASTGVANKPVIAMRVLLDGRPLPDGKGVWTPVAGKPAEATFTFDIPAGQHELKVLARTEDASNVSEAVIVTGPKTPGSQPTLHRVCVGINDYDDPGLKLGVAVKDAQDMFAALAANCVGPANRFGAAKGELIVNKDATRDRVLRVLTTTRKLAKPGDLVVIYFAGHGLKQDDAFYLVTREGSPAKSLKGLSLSGDDLRKALAEVECPVLMIMDACHSALAAGPVRAATDDLTRTLTDDTVGVTVLSAAMAHETAGASAENGHFTAGLLKGLRAGEGVPFDPYERQLYVHHLYAVAYSEVRRATNGKQNPFLNMPWTAPPLSLRDVPK